MDRASSLDVKGCELERRLREVDGVHYLASASSNQSQVAQYYGCLVLISVDM